MSEYKGIDHVKAAFKRQFTDRVPVYHIMGAFTTKLIGCSVKEYLMDSSKLVEAQLKAYELLKPDVVVILADLVMEVEALGNKIRFPENGYPEIKQWILENKKNLATLKGARKRHC